MATRKVDALARRAELEREDEELRARVGELGGRSREITQRIGEIDSAIAAAEVSAVRKGEQPDLAELQAERTQLQAEQHAHNTAGPALMRAYEAIPGQLGDLHLQHWPAFVKEAKELDTAAAEALAALEDAYRAAYGAWQTAAGRWEQSILHLHYGQQRAGDRQAQDWSGRSSPGDTPPSWPLEHPDQLFHDARRPRPPGR